MTEKNDIRNRFTLSTNLSRTADSKNPLSPSFKPAEWVSQAEAARIRGVSRQAIARLIKKGRFQVLEVGGKVLLKRSDIESFTPEPPGRPSHE
jgi:excisionase family DNA binding protein